MRERFKNNVNYYLHMLKIFNELAPFIEDCYREIGVREYSRILKITPPTASKILKNFESEDLLKKRTDKGYLLFRANRESDILKDLSRIYWRQRLKKIFDYINSEFHNPTIILFGSLAKLEAKKDSDIDIAILSKINKKINLEKYEKVFDREIQLFRFKSLNDIGKELRINIMNGYLIQGELR